jgi:hypothetical protein
MVPEGGLTNISLANLVEVKLVVSSNQQIQNYQSGGWRGGAQN